MTNVRSAPFVSAAVIVWAVAILRGEARRVRRPSQPDTQSAGRRRLVLLVGAVGAGTGLVVLVRMLGWLVTDGPFVSLSSGSQLVEPWRAIGATVPAAVAFFLATCLLLANRRVARGRLFVTLLVATVAATAAAPVGMAWYPQGSNARITALDPSTGEELWTRRVPVTQLRGVRSETPDVLEVEGSLRRRQCAWDLLLVRLDRTTGEILAVETLPQWYPSPEAVPPRPTTPPQSEFRFEHGTSPVVCHS